MFMTFWSRSHSLQRKIITAIVMVGLLPLTFLLALTYVEERRALRQTTGTSFKEVAVEAARRIEMHVTRGMNEAQQLATTPFLRTAVSEANRSYEGKDAQGILEIIRDWQQRWGSAISTASSRSLLTGLSPIFLSDCIEFENLI